MSYQGNGCPDCTEDKMCPNCYLGMAESVYEHAKNDLIEAQEATGNYIAAASYWDVQCKDSMLKVEHFKEKLAEIEAKRKGELK